MSNLHSTQPQLPKPFLKLFPETFNEVQTHSFHNIWNTDNNIVLQAPTGSGKTVIAKIAMLKGCYDQAKLCI